MEMSPLDPLGVGEYGGSQAASCDASDALASASKDVVKRCAAMSWLQHERVFFLHGAKDLPGIGLV